MASDALVFAACFAALAIALVVMAKTRYMNKRTFQTYRLEKNTLDLEVGGLYRIRVNGVRLSQGTPLLLREFDCLFDPVVHKDVHVAMKTTLKCRFTSVSELGVL